MSSIENVQQDVSIAGLDKGSVLFALWHGSQALGMSFLGVPPSGVTLEMCQEAVSANADRSNPHAYQGRPLDFDYWHGHVIKADLSGDSFDPWGYDRDNGQGAAARAVDAVREAGVVAS